MSQPHFRREGALYHVQAPEAWLAHCLCDSTDTNPSGPQDPRGLRKRVGACIESNVNGEFTDVSYLTCLKLVLMSSQNWDTSPKNLHSQRPLKIAPSEITGRALPRLQLAAATEAVALLLAEPGPNFADPSRHHLSGVTGLIISLIS